MPTDFSEDAVNNAIYNGILRGIDLAIEHKCFGSAIILLLSAIDAMAYVAMPEHQDDVTKTDFIDWAEKFIRFQGREQLTGADLYGARCAMLHSYGARSRMSRKGECRVIVWMDIGDPPIKQSEITPGYVAVSIQALRTAVFEGINHFLIDVFRDPKSKRAELVNRRLDTLVQQLSADEVLRAEG